MNASIKCCATFNHSPSGKLSWLIAGIKFCSRPCIFYEWQVLFSDKTRIELDMDTAELASFRNILNSSILQYQFLAREDEG